MGETRKGMIAVCGLDCGRCDIRRVPNDPEAAQRVVTWFKQKGWLKEDEGVHEVIERSMYCMGCRGDRSIHWSPECWILKCCVDEKGLEFCYQCEAFPCQRLAEWAKENTAYTQALGWLRQMKKGGRSGAVGY